MSRCKVLINGRIQEESTGVLKDFFLTRHNLFLKTENHLRQTVDVRMSFFR